MEKKPVHWVMDYETLVNCFIGVFVHYKDKSISRLFVIHGDQNDFPQMVKFLNDCVKHNQWHISYNGLAFDAQITQWMISNSKGLLSLPTDLLIKEIYGKAQDIIDRSNQGMFQQYRPDQIKVRQIDLFKMNHWDNKAKMSSLKWIQYSMNWENVEEMPHKHSDPVEDDETLKKVIEYCYNDVYSTQHILEHSKEQIQLRQTLTKEYGIDLYSASEPRISKELFLHFLSQKLDIPKTDIKAMRTPRPIIYLGQCILPYVSFKTPEFQGVLNYFQTKVITSTKDDFEYILDYKGVQTKYKLGGIHGAIKAGIYEAKNGYTIVTSDVTSFYPNLAIKNGFHPQHLPKKEFCELYEWFFEERKKIPKSDPRNYVYKIILNSTYGLTGDENSFLFDPKMTMQITINGQLLISMLYEMLAERIPEAIPLMQNTDGIEMMIPESKLDEYMQICDEWCLLTKLSLEHDYYSKMVIRNVNNYIAVYKNGKVKCKGAYEWEDLEKKKVSVFHKNKSFLIIPKTIFAYFVNGIKPEDYISGNKDIFDFCAGIKAKGGWYFEERYIRQGELFNRRLQKIVRYYISNSGSKIIKCNPDGRNIQVEAGEWLQTVVNEVHPDEPFENYDINFKYYLEEVYKEINEIEKHKFQHSRQLSLF